LSGAPVIFPPLPGAQEGEAWASTLQTVRFCIYMQGHTLTMIPGRLRAVRDAKLAVSRATAPDAIGGAIWQALTFVLWRRRQGRRLVGRPPPAEQRL